MATRKNRASTKVPIQQAKARLQRRTMSQSDTLKFFSDEGYFVPKRTIYLGNVTTDSDGGENGVDFAMARKFEVGMTVLEYFDAKSPITVIMNNPGGDQYHSMAIYERIMCSTCFVTIQATGHAMSGGSLILQAADKRLLARTATILLHYGEMGFSGHKIDFERWGDESKRFRLEMEEIYLQQMLKKDPTMTTEKLRALMQFDLLIDANRAVRLGLADGLVPWPKHKKVRPKASTSAPLASGEQE